MAILCCVAVHLRFPTLVFCMSLSLLLLLLYLAKHAFFVPFGIKYARVSCFSFSTDVVFSQLNDLFSWPNYCYFCTHIQLSVACVSVFAYLFHSTNVQAMRCHRKKKKKKKVYKLIPTTMASLVQMAHTKLFLFLSFSLIFHSLQMAQVRQISSRSMILAECVRVNKREKERCSER